MWIKGMLVTAAVSMVAGCSMSCRSGTGSTANAPLQEIEWTGAQGFTEWGQTKDGFFGISTSTPVFQEWKWVEGTLKRSEGLELSDVRHVIPLPEGNYLAYKRPKADKVSWPLIIAPLGAKDVIKKWEPPPGWGYDNIGVSRNRAYAAITLNDGDANPAQNPPGFQVGLLNIVGKELRWVVRYQGRIYGDIRQVAVSGDGKYIAMAGWNNGVALVDTQAGRIQWVKLPSNAVSFGYAMFSTDCLTLYAADAGGGACMPLKSRQATLSGSGTRVKQVSPSTGIGFHVWQ